MVVFALLCVVSTVLVGTTSASTTATLTATLTDSTQITVAGATFPANASGIVTYTFSTPIRQTVVTDQSGSFRDHVTIPAGFQGRVHISARIRNVSATPKSADSPSAATSPSNSVTRSATASTASALGFAVPEVFGMTSSELDTVLNRVAGSGATWIRLDMAWCSIEETQGQFDWSYTDSAVAAAATRNIQVLGLPTCTPAWAANGGDWTTGASSPGQQAGYVAFIDALAQRYKGKISAWEMWNEPNLDQFWSPKPSATSYASLVRAAVPKIRVADPTATILTGGIGDGPPPDIHPLPWLEALYAEDVMTLFDGVAVHLYPDYAAGTIGEMGVIHEYRSLLDRHGDATKQLWATEVGATTLGQPGASETLQAKLLTEQVNTWRTVPNRGPLFFYTLNDFPASDESESNFGLYRKDGSEKPAVSAFRALASIEASRS